jgi:hypothetical protein
MFRRILVPDQNPDNTLKLHQTDSGCCGSAITACKATVSFTNTDTISGITIKDRDGVNKLLSFTGVTGAANIKAAVKAALEAEGYEDDNVDGVGITVSAVSSNLEVTIIGEITPVSITDTGGPTNFATAKCSKVGICTFFYAWPGSAAASDLIINGTTASIASLTLAGNTAANVVSALTGAANWPAANTSVAVVETATAFEITITSVATDLFTLGGADFERSDCAQDYI